MGIGVIIGALIGGFIGILIGGGVGVGVGMTLFPDNELLAILVSLAIGIPIASGITILGMAGGNALDVSV